MSDFFELSDLAYGYYEKEVTYTYLDKFIDVIDKVYLKDFVHIMTFRDNIIKEITSKADFKLEVELFKLKYDDYFKEINDYSDDKYIEMELRISLLSSSKFESWIKLIYKKNIIKD